MAPPRRRETHAAIAAAAVALAERVGATREGRVLPVLFELTEAQGITLDADGQPIHWSYAPLALVGGGKGEGGLLLPNGAETEAPAAAGMTTVVPFGSPTTTAAVPVAPTSATPEARSPKPRFWQRLYRRKSQTQAQDGARAREKQDRELAGCSFAPTLASVRQATAEHYTD